MTTSSHKIAALVILNEPRHTKTPKRSFGGNTLSSRDGKIGESKSETYLELQSLGEHTLEKKHHFPPNRYIYLHRANSWQLLTVMQKFALEQNFHIQASRYFVCTFHQIDKCTSIKM